MTFKPIERKSAFWSPDTAGQHLTGIVLERIEGNFGQQLVIDDEETKKATTTPSHRWLQNLLEDVAIGERVRITYQGTEPPKVKGQNPTKIYVVERDEPDDAGEVMAS